MKKSAFTRWFALGLLSTGVLLWVSLSIRVAAMGKGKTVPARDATAVATIKQLERDMGNAMVAGDINKHSIRSTPTIWRPSGPKAGLTMRRAY